MTSFNELDLPQQLLSQLNKIGYKTPTDIQSKSIPEALQGKDVLATARTGTGKTAAFLIPLLSKILTEKGVYGLILLPTRELAMQVHKALRDFIGQERIKTAMLIGGDPIGPQINLLKLNPRIIVGTPGRVNDHLDRGTLNIDKVNFLVLDEVDRMLDMGFGIQLEEIQNYFTSKPQTLMFSATLPSNIKSLSQKYLQDPVRVSSGEHNKIADNIEEINITLKESEKYDKLISELKDRVGSILVFVRTKLGADNMSRSLRKDGHKVDAIHGDLRQSKRKKVITEFSKMKFRILVATGVASRGLDIPHIEHVINYDIPEDPEEYIHRVGRTARNGEKGCAVNFITNSDKSKWRAIEILLNPEKYPQGNISQTRFNNRPRQFRGYSSNNRGFSSNRDDFRKSGNNFGSRNNNASFGRNRANDRFTRSSSRTRRQNFS